MPCRAHYTSCNSRLALLIDCGGNYVELFVLGRGLEGSGEATFAATAVFMVLALALVTFQPPAEAHGQIRIWRLGCSAGAGEAADETARAPGEAGEAAEAGAAGEADEAGEAGESKSAAAKPVRTATIAQYFRDSGFMFTRSLLLQASVYSMARVDTRAAVKQTGGGWVGEVNPSNPLASPHVAYYHSTPRVGDPTACGYGACGEAREIELPAPPLRKRTLTSYLSF